MSKPQEFWIIDEWNPVIADRTVLDQDPRPIPSSANVFHVREVSPAYDEAVKGLVEALTKLDEGFEDYRKDGACLFCDKGDSGYSTKGPGHYDDIGRKCASLFVHEALEAYKAATRSEDETK